MKRLAICFLIFAAPGVGLAAENSLRELEKKLRDPIELTRHSAAEELTRVGGEEARKIFERLAARDGTENKRVGLVGLAHVAPEKSAPLFAAELENPSWAVRWAAVHGLGRTGDPAWLARLQKIASDDPALLSQQKRYPVRDEAAVAIRRIEQSPRWLLSLDEARARAANEKKDLLVFWYLPSAPWNQRMLQESFYDPQFQTLKEAFVWVKIDAAREKELADRLAIQEVPLLQMLRPDGTERERWTGYYQAAGIARELNAILKGAATTDELIQKAEQNPSDLAVLAELARRYERSNRLAMAVPLWEKILRGEEKPGKNPRREALLALGHYYGQKGNYTPSVKYLERYCEEFSSSPDAPKARYCLALSYLGLGRERSGIPILKELAQESSDGKLSAAASETLREVENRKGKRGTR